MFENLAEFRDWLESFKIWYSSEYGKEDMEDQAEWLLGYGVVTQQGDNYVNVPIDAYKTGYAGESFYLFERNGPCKDRHPDLYKVVLDAHHPAFYDMHMLRWYQNGGTASVYAELLQEHPLIYDSKEGLIERPKTPQKVTPIQFISVMGQTALLNLNEEETKEVYGKGRKELYETRMEMERIAGRGTEVLNHTLPIAEFTESTDKRGDRKGKSKRPRDGDWMTDAELENWYRKYTKYADWEGVYTLAKEGDLDMAGQVRPDIAIRNYSNLTKIQTRFISGRNTNHLRGVWIWGDSGSGKSTLARLITGGEHYVKLANKWWDGYRGEKYVILDDLMPVHSVLGYHLKLWADRHDTTGEVKGGAVGLAYEWLIVTSQYSVDKIFTKKFGNEEVRDTETINAINRRFLVLRPDGLHLGRDERLLDVISAQAVAIRKALDHIESTGEIPDANLLADMSRDNRFGY